MALPGVYRAVVTKASIDNLFRGNMAIFETKMAEAASVLVQCGQHVAEAERQIDEVLKPVISDSDARMSQSVCEANMVKEIIQQLHDGFQARTTYLKEPIDLNEAEQTESVDRLKRRSHMT